MKLIGLDSIGLKGLKNLIELIMPKDERRKRNIIINYIRIYTHLNNAFNLLDKSGCKRAMEHLSIAKHVSRKMSYREESNYIKRIISTLEPILKNSKAITEQITMDEASDPYHVKTSVMLAQNICILRILKIHKYSS